MRNTIFISHTHSEKDNLFAQWLNAKLMLLGYDSWCELDRFVGGEECWLEIEDVLKNKTILFIVIISDDYCKKLRTGGSGVRMELNFAQKATTIPDGNILPILIDNFSLEDLPIELNPIWFTDNKNNWEIALKNIIEKLEKEKIIKIKQSESVLSYWYKSKKIDNTIIPKNEIYYSNWWGVENLPKTMYIFKYHNKFISKEVSMSEIYPSFYHGNHVCSFKSQLTEFSEKYEEDINLELIQVFPIKIEEIINGIYENDEYPTLKDAEYLLKRLLKKAVRFLLFDRELKTYELANKQSCFFYKNGIKEKNKVSYSYKNQKTKTKKLVGKYLDDMWHFGVSFKVILYPYAAFSLKSHIVFSYDGKKMWEDKNKVHSARRKKGKRFFNEEWRDLLIAFLHSLADENGDILIPLTENFNIKMKKETIMFQSNFGYIEPKSKERLEVIIEDFENKEMKI